MHWLFTIVLDYIEYIAVTGGLIFFWLFVGMARGTGRQKQIMMACQLGDDREVAYLLREVPWLARAADQNGLTPLHIAALNGFVIVVGQLLDKSANPNAANNAGQTPLHAAAMAGHADVVAQLLAKGAKVDCRDHQGNTPLYLAVWDNHTEVAKVLLDRGADVNSVTCRGDTPLNRALQHNHQEVAEVLLAAGAIRQDRQARHEDFPAAGTRNS